MTPTHILIPIKDIEEKIKGLKNQPQTDIVKSHIALWDTLKIYYKQISLNEKDIEGKAKLKYPKSIEWRDDLDAYVDKNEESREAYSEALKDLL